MTYVLMTILESLFKFNCCRKCYLR